MKTNKLYWLLMVMMVGIGIVFSTTTYAYMVSETETISNEFDPAQVSCQVTETFENNVKSSITVKNTGDIDAYIRVRLVSYWVDAEGKIVSEPSKTGEELIKLIKADEDEGEILWIADSPNDTYYYKNKVSIEAETSNLLTESSITLMPNEKGYRQVVEVFAEAIQAEPAKAAESAWNVKITDGKISSVNSE